MVRRLGAGRVSVLSWQSARFNESKAAKALGLARHQLYIRMRRHGLE